MGKKEIAVGGQAVIEGVMMRGPEYIATAVRRKDKTIEVKRELFISRTKTNSLLGLPIIRGFVSLIEMLVIGMKTLGFSAQRAEVDWKEEEKEKGKEVKEISKSRKQLEEVGSYIFAFGLLMLLIAYLPYKIADLLKLKENLYINIFAGSIRIIFFVLYVYLISLMKDVKRIFEYHGAEHKTVHAYEKDSNLQINDIQRYTTIHPRCGTSFMFFVLLISILIFSIVDSIVAAKIGRNPTVLVRLSYHFLLIPFISGISYEVLRFSGKNISHPIVKLMTAPGMALQKITTQPPDDEQIEVALVSMKYALDMDISDNQNIVILDKE
ncbi:MAG: DUF1385 domain-containing protein [Candidatus Cloacimonetes bacterium]|nr:DUF1385 domain-containing protein [Candidatus Cloacimonadota bacterium]